VYDVERETKAFISSGQAGCRRLQAVPKDDVYSGLYAAYWIATLSPILIGSAISDIAGPCDEPPADFRATEALAAGLRARAGRWQLIARAAGGGNGLGRHLLPSKVVTRNKLSKRQHEDEASWSTRSWLSLQAQRMSVALQLGARGGGSAEEIATELCRLAAASDPPRLCSLAFVPRLCRVTPKFI